MALDYRQCHINAGWAMGNIPLYLYLQSIWAFASGFIYFPTCNGFKLDNTSTNKMLQTEMCTLFLYLTI